VAAHKLRAITAHASGAAKTVQEASADEDSSWIEGGSDGFGGETAMPYPVLIVGAGPTGLTIALDLSCLDIPVRLIDKQREAATTSRAIGVQARTLELLEQRGLAEEMVHLGNPGLAGSVYGGGQRVFRLDFGHVDSHYAYVCFISQAETERILRDAIGRQGVTIERGVELVGLSQDALTHDPSPVKAVLRHADGLLELAQAPWLISAEGAHSVARTTLDLPARLQ
jgi:2-polyprenyl-6-methoxyphenol hydroxylase-like FAD-dependent oxidoreductase